MLRFITKTKDFISSIIDLILNGDPEPMFPAAMHWKIDTKPYRSKPWSFSSNAENYKKNTHQLSFKF